MIKASSSIFYVVLLVTLLLLVGCRGCGAPSTKPTKVDAVATALVDAINAGDTQRRRSLYAPSMLQAFPENDEQSFIDQVMSRGKLGAPVKVEGESEHDGAYLISTAEGAKERLVLHTDAQDKITGYTLKLVVDESRAAPPVRTTEGVMQLDLPVRGEWKVVWGGSTPASNRHVTSADGSQRRAADLVKVDPTTKKDRIGVATDGGGSGGSSSPENLFDEVLSQAKNTDFVGYGAEVLAVADGDVVSVVDGFEDHERGSKGPATEPAGGNEITIGHATGSKNGNAIYSVYSHLQRNVRVKKGDRVKRGDTIGLCGNSGNTTQPHLHFQVQDGPTGSSWGMEPIFTNVHVTRGGKTSDMTSYTFEKDDLIVVNSNSNSK